MPSPTRDDITQLLARARDGDADALNDLLPLVYEELRVLAHGVRVRGGAADTLNTTALVHEAFERLAAAEAGWEDRRHFFRVSARAMRQILVDHARAQKTAKRGGDRVRVPLDVERIVPAARASTLLALDEALDRLAVLDPRQADIVELRYYIGLTIPETADVLDLSPATVKRAWSMARAWLHDEIATVG